MSERVQKQKTKNAREETQAEEPSVPEQRHFDDSLLDEIDATLEENTLVAKDFLQKGGE